MSFHSLWCYKEFIVSLGCYGSLPEFFIFYFLLIVVLIQPTQVPSMNRNVTLRTILLSFYLCRPFFPISF